MTSNQKIALAAVIAGAVAVGAVLGIRAYRNREQPLQLTGAVIREDPDVNKQSPIAGVQVTALHDGMIVARATSGFFGSFSLRLPQDLAAGDSIMLQFRDPQYQPLDETQILASTLDVVRLVPLHGEVEAQLNPNAVAVTDVLVRYSVQTSTSVSVGTDATTFKVVNRANVPCRGQRPCSPDGKWKAVEGSASLDAGVGNIFRNARAVCIAGPCPFTHIDTDGFSRGGRKINITVRDWSDTTTFLLEAEVMHSQIGDVERKSYPLIFGQEMDFTVPPGAEGTSLEAEINGTETIFPLGPNPQLSWAECKVAKEANQAQDYRCLLKRGFRFSVSNESTPPTVTSGPSS